MIIWGKLQFRTQTKKISLLMCKVFLEIPKKIMNNLREKQLKDRNRQFTEKEVHEGKAESIHANVNPEVVEPKLFHSGSTCLLTLLRHTKMHTI